MPTQRVPLELVGASTKASSERQDSGRTVNLLVETVNGKPALRAAPGFFRWASSANLGAATGAKTRGGLAFENRFFCVVGNQVLELQRDLTLNTWSSTTVLGTLPSTSGKVGLSYNNGYLLIGDGFFWSINLSTLAMAAVLDNPTGGEQIPGYYSVWLDGTTLYFERDSSKYWYSAINDPTSVTGTAFFSAEFNPDNTLSAYNVNAQIVILGERSAEWHWDSGDANNPFQRISGGHVEYGCVGRWASCRFGDSVAMVGRNHEGSGKVYLLGNAGQIEPISSPAVEKALEKVLFALYDDTAGITMWSYSEGGHECLVLNLPAAPATSNNVAEPSKTWCYDRTSGAWTELGYTNPDTGMYERVLSDWHVTYNGRHYTGDYSAANIYEMSHDYFRENTIPLVKTRTLPRISFQGQRFSVNRVEIVGDTGSGRDGSATGGTDPQLMLRWRWDGKPWNNEVHRSWGKIGAFNVRAILGPCGGGFEFELEVACSEPIHFVLTEGWADVTVGG